MLIIKLLLFHSICGFFKHSFSSSQFYLKTKTKRKNILIDYYFINKKKKLNKTKANQTKEKKNKINKINKNKFF